MVVKNITLSQLLSIIKHPIKMDYTSTLETLEDLWMTLSWYPGVPNTKSELGRSSTPWLRFVILEIPHCTQQEPC